MEESEGRVFGRKGPKKRKINGLHPGLIFGHGVPSLTNGPKFPPGAPDYGAIPGDKPQKMLVHFGSLEGSPMSVEVSDANIVERAASCEDSVNRVFEITGNAKFSPEMQKLINEMRAQGIKCDVVPAHAVHVDFERDIRDEFQKYRPIAMPMTEAEMDAERAELLQRANHGRPFITPDEAFEKCYPEDGPEFVGNMYDVFLMGWNAANGIFPQTDSNG